MKKAYNNTWVSHIYLRRIAENWHHKNLLTQAQLDAIKAQFPEHFHKPGIFVKIGLFFFACLCCLFFGGFVSIFFIDGGGDDMLSVVSLICAACFLFGLEFSIREQKLFHSGIDNALLYSTIMSAATAIFLLFPDAPLAVYCIVILAFCIPAVLRYADLLVTFAAFTAFLLLIASFLIEFPVGKALLPFGFMLSSMAVYFSIRHNRDVYYYQCQQLLEALSLVTFYAGGNYLVVREGNAMLNHLPVSAQVTFAYLFYFFTAAIPLAYIYFGLKQRDRILLVTGLLAAAFSLVTYRTYFLDLSPSQELTLAGILLIAFPAIAIYLLKTPKYGISDEQEGKRRFGNLEAVLVSQTLGQASPEGGITFGGGNFGGGGAGQAY